MFKGRQRASRRSHASKKSKDWQASSSSTALSSLTSGSYCAEGAPRITKPATVRQKADAQQQLLGVSGKAASRRLWTIRKEFQRRCHQCHFVDFHAFSKDTSGLPKCPAQCLMDPLSLRMNAIIWGLRRSRQVFCTYTFCPCQRGTCWVEKLLGWEPGRLLKHSTWLFPQVGGPFCVSLCIKNHEEPTICGLEWGPRFLETPRCIDGAWKLLVRVSKLVHSDCLQGDPRQLWSTVCIPKGTSGSDRIGHSLA